MAQGMAPCGVRTLLLLAAAGALMSAEATAWNGAGAQRFTVAREKDGPWPVTVGWARVYPAGEAAHPEVQVTTEAGVAVAAQLLWSAAGAPVDVLFDAHAGAATYQVYLAAKPGTGAPPAFDPQAGLVLETRHRTGPGLDSWAQFQEAWRGCAGEVLGASLVPHVFDGIHRHGPGSDYMSHYHGRIQAAKAGEYLFATISDDGSFVFIDGKPVCEWPGVHGVDGGQRGQHQGAITLSAGGHQLDYWHFQGGGESYAELAWRPPGAERLEVVPPTAFLAVGRFPALHAETRAGAQAAAFSWEMAGHTTIGGEAGGPALVDVRLHLLERAGLAARWVFDDGTTAEGVEVEHLFPRTGLRTVRCEVGQGGRPLGDLSHAILVHPMWLQPEDFPEHRWQAQRKELIGRQPLAMPVADLAALIAYADALHELELLSRLGAAALKRAGEFTGAEAQALLRLGFHFQHQEVRQYQAARECLGACVAADKVPPSCRPRPGCTSAGCSSTSTSTTPARAPCSRRWRPTSSAAMTSACSRCTRAMPCSPPAWSSRRAPATSRPAPPPAPATCTTPCSGARASRPRATTSARATTTPPRAWCARSNGRPRSNAWAPRPACSWPPCGSRARRSPSPSAPAA